MFGVLNNQRGALISSLSAKDEGRFWQTGGQYLLVVLGGVCTAIGRPIIFLRESLGLQRGGVGSPIVVVKKVVFLTIAPFTRINPVSA